MSAPETPGAIAPRLAVPAFGHAGERVHHAPNRAEQSEKRRTAHRRREQDHLRLELERGLADGALHRGVDRAHLRRRNFVGDLEPRAKSFVHFGRAEHMKRHLLATGAINIEIRRTGKARVFLEQTQWLSILPESGEKARVLFSGELDHAHLRDHDRPAENRADGEEKQDELAGNGGVLECEKQTAGR